MRSQIKQNPSALAEKAEGNPASPLEGERQFWESEYKQSARAVKSCTFLLPGEKIPRTCSFQEMMRIIRDRCPNGKLKELRIA